MSDTASLPNVKTFSVLDAIKGTAYPSDEITVYTDVASLYQIQRLESEAADQTDPDLADEIHAEIEEYRLKILASGLTFHLRGIPPEIKDNNLAAVRAKFALNEGDDIIHGSNAYEFLMNTHLAEMIQKVVRADGDVDSHHWTPEEVSELFGVLGVTEAGRLQALGSDLSFQAFAFDQAVTPDFS